MVCHHRQCILLELFLTLFGYNFWANRKLIEAAEPVNTLNFKAPAGLSHDSLCGALTHVLAAEIVWRQRCQVGVSPSALLTAADFDDIDALRSRWEQEMDAWQGYLSGLAEAALQAEVYYRTTRGQEKHDPLWQLLLHVVNHGTQFRSEAAVALSRLGHSPGDLDLLAYLRSGHP
jgi:uncharacterized damage-inducible protein DinB